MLKLSSKLVLVLSAVGLVATLSVPAGGAHASGGVSCVASLNPACSAGVIATEWVCGEYPGWDCYLDIAFTLESPEGHCVYAGIEGFMTFSGCGAVSDTFEYPFFTVADDFTMYVLRGFVCIDTPASYPNQWTPRCAHWTHHTPPAPPQGGVDEQDLATLEQGIGDQTRWTFFPTEWCPPGYTCTPYTPVAGAGAQAQA